MSDAAIEVAVVSAVAGLLAVFMFTTNHGVFGKSNPAQHFSGVTASGIRFLLFFGVALYVGQLIVLQGHVWPLDHAPFTLNGLLPWSCPAGEHVVSSVHSWPSCTAAQ